MTGQKANRTCDDIEVDRHFHLADLDSLSPARGRGYLDESGQLTEEKMNHVLKSVVLIALFACIAFPSSFHPLKAIPGLSYIAPSRSPLPQVSDSARAAREEVALAQHLSDKYRQPLGVTNEIVKAAYFEGSRQGVPPLLLLAIAEKESSLRQSASNPFGAMGLMQVVPRFHPEKIRTVGESNILKPAANMRVGAWILAEYLAGFNGDLSKALVRYSGNARNYGVLVEQYKVDLERIRDQATLLDI